MKAVLNLLMIVLGVVLIVVVGVYLYLLSQSTTQGSVTWQSCYRPSYWSWFEPDFLPPVSLQCATVFVPVDDSKPDGKTFAIALTRLPSTDKNPIGDLLLLSGGPGGHSLDMGYVMLDTAVGKDIKGRFHILGYAPRGIKPSTPSIDCGGRQEDDDDVKAYMQACIEHTGVDILPFVSSKEVVKDLEYIRKALDNDTWSMMGYSYGTKLVTKYAERYPTHLRAGVADGVVDTSEDLPTIWRNQYHHAQIAFERFMAWCDDCVFDKTKTPSLAFLHTLQMIEDKKLTGGDGKPIDKKSLLAIFNDNLNDETLWWSLKAMFDELMRGETQFYNEHLQMAKLGESGFSEDGLVVVNCADSAPKLNKDEYINFTKTIDQQATYDDIKPKTNKDYLDACYYWHWQGTDDVMENLVTDNTPTLLFVSYEYDFATPYANAQKMAQRFDDPLIVLIGQQGHGASLLSNNSCVDGYVQQYLFDPKRVFKDKLLICTKS